MPVITELLARLGVDSRDFEKKLRDAERTLKKQAGAVDSISRKINAGVTAIVAGLGARAVIRATDAFTTLQNRLRAVTDSQSELVQVQEQLVRISRETRSSVAGNVKLFSRLALSTKELGVTEVEVLQFTKSLNQAIKLSGATAQEAQAGIIQLAQGMASGALRGDELRSVLEQLPAVADVIAKGLGVTRGELRKLGSEGKITAVDILSAFRDARVELDERFGDTIPTLAEGFQRLDDELVLLAGAFSEALGFGESFGEALDSIADGIINLASRIRETDIIGLLGRIFNPGGQAATDPLAGARERALERLRKRRGGGAPADVGAMSSNSVEAFFGAQQFASGQSGPFGATFAAISQGFDTIRQKSTETFAAMSDAGINFLLGAPEQIRSFLTEDAPEQLSTFQQAWLDSFQHVADTTTTMTQIAAGAVQSFFQGFANALVQAITQTADFGEAFVTIFTQVLANLLQTLIAFVLEVIALKIAELIFNTAAAESKFGLGGVIAAVVAIPILIGALIALSKSQSKRAGEAVGLDTGGLVTNDGLALLHAGEVVATPQEVKDAMSGDRGGFEFNLHMDGRLVARSILPHIPREIRMRGV